MNVLHYVLVEITMTYVTYCCSFDQLVGSAVRTNALGHFGSYRPILLFMFENRRDVYFLQNKLYYQQIIMNGSITHHYGHRFQRGSCDGWLSTPCESSRWRGVWHWSRILQTIMNQIFSCGRAVTSHRPKLNTWSPSRWEAPAKALSTF
jgi:hypothetical protein